MEICKQQNEFELRHLSAVDRLKRGRGRFFNQKALTRPIHFSYNFLSSMQIMDAKGLGGLWAIEWAWHIRVTNLRWVQGYGI